MPWSIGIGEVARHIIGKAIATVISDNIQAAPGPLQVCAGHLSGCEAAVHAMCQVFDATDTDATILVDVSNAFNSLNRQAALCNIHQLCFALLSPECSSTPIEKTSSSSSMERSFVPRGYYPRRPPCNGNVRHCHHTTD